MNSKRMFPLLAALFLCILALVCAASAIGPSIESCNSTGTTKDTFDPSDDLYIIGSGFPLSTVHDVYVVSDVTWTDGMAIPVRVVGTVTAVASDSSGNIPPTIAWSAPVINGKYDVCIDVNGNGLYDVDIDALDDNDVQVTAGFIVLPTAQPPPVGGEWVPVNKLQMLVPWIGLASTIAIAASFVGTRRIKKQKKRTLHFRYDLKSVKLLARAKP